MRKKSFILAAIMAIALNCNAQSTNEEFYKLKYCSTVVYMVPRA